MSSKKDTTKNIGRGAIWSVLNQAASQFMVLGIFLVTARFISKEDFGIMAICMMVVEFFKQVCLESIAVFYLSKKSPIDSDYNTSFWIILILGIVGACSIYFSAPFISDILNNPELQEPLEYIAFIIFTISLYRTHEIWLVKHLQFKALALRSIISISIGGGVGIYLAIEGYGIMSLISQQIITSAIAVIWLWLSTSWKPSRPAFNSNVKDLWNFSKFIALQKISGFFGAQADPIFISYYLGNAQTGIFNATKRLILAVDAIVGFSICDLILVRMAEHANNTESLREEHLNNIKILAVFIAPIFTGLAVLAPEIINILLGPKWQETALPLSILSIGSFFSILSIINVMSINIQQKTSTTFLISIINTITLIAIFIIFTRYGIVTLVSCLVIGKICLHFLPLYFCKKYTGLRIRNYIKALFSPVFAAFLMFITTMALKQQLAFDSLLTILCIVPFGVLIYCIIFFMADKKTAIKHWMLIKEIIAKKQQ